ncbi:MAG: hypothetical protein V9G13_03675 [Marmoricola sp.]
MSDQIDEQLTGDDIEAAASAELVEEADVSEQAEVGDQEGAPAAEEAEDGCPGGRGG